MKYAYTFLMGWIWVFSAQSQTPGHLLDVNARSVLIDSADGRKMMIILLPAQTDTGLLGQMMRFQQRHGSQVRVIGIMTSDSSSKTALAAQTGLGKLSTVGVILTTGMAASDSVTGPRGKLVKYLSARSRNRQVDKLVVGCKYFLSESGKPFAQLGPNNSLDSRLADYIVQAKVPGESRN